MHKIINFPLAVHEAFGRVKLVKTAGENIVFIYEDEDEDLVKITIRNTLKNKKKFRSYQESKDRPVAAGKEMLSNLRTTKKLRDKLLKIEKLLTTKNINIKDLFSVFLKIFNQSRSIVCLILLEKVILEVDRKKGGRQGITYLKCQGKYYIYVEPKLAVCIDNIMNYAKEHQLLELIELRKEIRKRTRFNRRY